MSTSSPDRTNPTESGAPDAQQQLLHAHLARLAIRSRDQRQYLERLAVELQNRFAADAAMVSCSAWQQPVVQIGKRNQPEILSLLGDDNVSILLETATPLPTSCNVPLEGSESQETPRALRVEVADTPQRVVILILFTGDRSPNPHRQVDDLNQLRRYSESVGQLLPGIPTAKGQPNRQNEDSAERHEGTISSVPRPASLRHFHASLDSTETCFRIANESRRLIGCDRVTVLLPKRKHFRVRSVSGVAVVNRRSDSLRSTERLVDAAVVLDERIDIPGDDLLPPQIQQPLENYLDASDVSAAALLPIHAPQDPDGEDDTERVTKSKPQLLGVILLESFSGVDTDFDRGRVEPIVQEASLALRNAREHQSIPIVRFWKLLGRLLEALRRPAIIAVLLLAAAAIWAAATVKVEHYVVATGIAEPSHHKEVFAPVDGTVRKLHLADGQTVTAGDVLIELENPELQSRAESITGEIQTATGRLASIQSLRLSGQDDPSQSNRLALEENQLTAQLSNLHEQQKIVEDQISQMRVVSPIDGVVVAWQVERRLMGRPVNRGNLLCGLSDPSGQWSLRLTIPEENAGPVLDAISHDQQPAVRFAIATLPQETFTAQLALASYAARVDERGQRVVDLRAEVDSVDENLADWIGDLRVGADVTAKIECGPRTIAHSWFSDVIDFAQRHILFRFR